ncbi:serine hydrolase FSH [Talaromyces proteolyticus]|uniref:Serine hydrolase FSH n=1 Tax=Talaromyces proteolyticus TaxID=1131652 RepID=A0AAD4PUJ3_9EURO|nr:serine hydrolase FSH [Talaromyces proteolyticus]KAH8692260.1 serine hydrolase FSH [Talaromyces proteolyticus]
MLRILCIHGGGSSSEIFESQTTALRSLLPNSWEWVFHDAELECAPLPSIKNLYPGPYFTFFLVPSVSRMNELHEWFLNLIEEEGPFDGLMGFSMGGYVPLSLMLKRQKHYPLMPPLFRFMVFWGGNLPWSADQEEGIEVTDWILAHRLVPPDIEDIRSFNAWAAEHPDDRPDPDDPTGINPALHPLIPGWLAGKVFDRRNYYTRVYHPDVTQTRLQIPTLHVLGKADEVYGGSKRMAELCNAKTRVVYEHKGGHDVPRDRTDILRIKELFEKTVARSQQLA